MKLNWRDIRARKATILLDGVSCRHVHEADDEAGYVVRCIADPNMPGRCLIVGDEWATETVKGKVEIVFDQPNAASQ